MSEYYIGLMSGTSADAIDAALVCFEPQLEVIASHAQPLPNELRERLRGINRDSPLHAVACLDVELAELFARTASALLERAAIGPSAVAAIGSHGQTLWHEPDGEPPFTLQVGDPNRIAERTGITTVADFRRRDIAAGGQGAPLVPAFHRALLASGEECRVVLNLGGIANISVLRPGSETRGFDTGPANCLLDAWIHEWQGLAYDRNGAWAADGDVDQQLLEVLLTDPYFAASPPKSTGLEYFNAGWLRRHLDELTAAPTAVDVQATLLELTARTICDAIEAHAPDAARLLVCGGGAHNAALMQRLAQRLQRPVESTAAYGLDPDYVEACAFAWLAKQTLTGGSGNEPAVTGASHRVPLGGVYSAGQRS